VNIWQYAQNKPSLIARDFLDIAGVPEKVTYCILMARGVFKWLAVRRDLIRLKNEWRDELTQLYRAIENGEIKRGTPKHRETVGYIRALECCRKQVRALCHSQRWRAVDHDSKSLEFLRVEEKGE
jgi:hypothetical protein